MTFKLGFHASVAGGFENALDALDALDANCGQIFCHAPQSYSFDVDTKKAAAFKKRYRSGNYFPIVCHSSYLINIASPKKDVWVKSYALLKKEIEACDQLGVEYLNFHPGAHTGSGVEEGIKKICETVDKVAPMLRKDLMLVFENTSGKGTTIGTTIEELAQLMKGCKTKHVGICIDTCHAFSAGYAIHTENGLNEFVEKFDTLIGLKHLVSIHINDSLTPFGEKKDRHQHIGDGEIGKEGFRRILNHPKLKDKPFILETPANEKDDEDNLAMCRKLRQ